MSEFAVDESIGRELHAFILLKGCDQEAVVKRIIQRKGNRAFGLTAASDAGERRYSSGRIAAMSLDCDRLDERALEECSWGIECVEPFSIDLHEGILAYTHGSELRLLDLHRGDVRSITHPWLAFAHTVEFSADGASLLASSAGFDTVLEFNVASETTSWEWNAWDNGIERVPLDGSYVTRDGGRAEALRRRGHDVLLIGDPADWPTEGLPTHRSPARLNGAAYDDNGDVLVTFYHRPELARVERDGRCLLIDRQLVHPHNFVRSLLPQHDGFLVTDSGRGELLFLDESCEETGRLTFASLPADSVKAYEFGEWIQTVSVLDAKRGLLAAVDALRDGVHLIDLRNRRRRFLSNPPSWRLHAVRPASVWPPL